MSDPGSGAAVSCLEASFELQSWEMSTVVSRLRSCTLAEAVLLTKADNVFDNRPLYFLLFMPIITCTASPTYRAMNIFARFKIGFVFISFDTTFV